MSRLKILSRVKKWSEKNTVEGEIDVWKPWFKDNVKYYTNNACESVVNSLLETKIEK